VMKPGGTDSGPSLLTVPQALTCVVAVTVLAVAAPPFGLHFPMEPSTSWGLAEKIVFMGFAVGLELTSPAAYFLVTLFAPPLRCVHCWVSGYWPTLFQWLVFLPKVAALIGVCMSVCLHRYFSHKAFQTSRVMQFVVGIGACMAYQGGPLWWAAKHVRHHRHCDLSCDPHSVLQQGFLYAFLGWGYNPDSYSKPDYQYLEPDLLVPELRLLQLLNNVPVIMLCLWASYVYGYPAMVFGILQPMHICRVITFLFNVEFHPADAPHGKACKGSDISRWLALIVGESMHGDHHTHPRRSRRMDLDLSWWLTIAWMQPLGLVWNCR